ncbi:YajQ family cyclic di-GMP-binding protein [Thiomicrospira microaerophila]|uniref:YajQ family cyclic di-GMP-binding protein n=1 Tax=Thiomicrospira microaerophila TaxID=406020 RepID=UPI0020103F23|nr:YajQ family cyclic di-GMP-binding protein [Thiomicrospira microaerophila]UQB42529.1 YajQ family cyclic di-GMP-binding protein [Thiomicrospira microaerophila]
MPSFDIVSEVDKHELTNAVDQANKEVTTRFDFKGTDSYFELKELEIKMNTESEFQLDQMYNVLTSKLSKRGIDLRAIELKEPDVQLKTAKQSVIVHQGLDAPVAKKIIKLLKDAKLKVQAQIQGDSVRVTGKKRDDLQEAIALLKAQEDFERPLQFNNFRD